jgi:methylmalonyl-CoA epimerase
VPWKSGPFRAASGRAGRNAALEAPLFHVEARPTYIQMNFALDHLGIAVKSLESAKAIYQTLGLTTTHEEEVPAEKVRVVMVPIGDTRLELLEPTTEDSVIGKFIAKRGEGLHHISLRVPDLDAAVTKLKEQGVRLVSEKNGIGVGGHRYIFIHPSSAGGVLLELVESSH